MPRPPLPTLVDNVHGSREVIQAIKRLDGYGGDLEARLLTLEGRIAATNAAVATNTANAQVRAITAQAGITNATTSFNPGTATAPSTVPGVFAVNTNLALAQPGGIPARPNLRWFRANMCGLRIPGLPPVSGGAADPTLFLTWFYDRYGPADRATIRAAYVAAGLTHFHLSWCDSRVFGTSIATYVSLAQELAAAGLYVGHFWCGKDQDTGKSNATIMADITPVITALQAAGGVLPWCSVGWELSLWRTPTEVQDLIDQIAVLVAPPACNLYVHFQEGYLSFPQPGMNNASFWNPNVGKLTGCLYQKALAQDNGLFQSTIDDCLDRFAGNDGFVNDSGFGHPFDFVAYEVTASFQFAGSLTLAQGDAVGLAGIYAPARTGPGPTTAVVMGYGNGATGSP